MTELNELDELRWKIVASRRIIAGESLTEPCSDPVVEQILVEELERRLPDMERRVLQLEGFEGDADRRES